MTQKNNAGFWHATSLILFFHELYAIYVEKTGPCTCDCPRKVSHPELTKPYICICSFGVFILFGFLVFLDLTC